MRKDNGNFLIPLLAKVKASNLSYSQCTKQTFVDDTLCHLCAWHRRDVSVSASCFYYNLRVIINQRLTYQTKKSRHIV